MKTILILAAAALLLLSCSADKPKEDVTVRIVEGEEIQIDPVPEKTNLPASPMPPNDSLNISGSVSYRLNYCGGAYPPEDLMKELNTPKPFKGELYLKQGYTKTLITTDVKGNFDCTLKPGKYKVYLAQNRIGPEEYWYDEQLDGKWWAQQVFATVDVKQAGNIKFTLDFICSPTNRRRP